MQLLYFQKCANILRNPPFFKKKKVQSPFRVQSDSLVRAKQPFRMQNGLLPSFQKRFEVEKKIPLFQSQKRLQRWTKHPISHSNWCVESQRVSGSNSFSCFWHHTANWGGSGKERKRKEYLCIPAIIWLALRHFVRCVFYSHFAED